MLLQMKPTDLRQFIDDTHDCHDLYSFHCTSDLKTFFDFYCKDNQTGWEQTPAVRYEVLDHNRPNNEISLLDSWIQSESKSLRLRLEADRSLTETKSNVSIDETALQEDRSDAPAINRDDDDGEMLLTHTFNDRTIVVGPSTMTFQLSAENQNDLDIT